MNVKRFVKLFVPPIVLEFKDFVRGVDRRLIKSPLPQIHKHSENVIIMGNGPSLNQSLNNYKPQILKNDRMAVNFFASTDLYEIIRPNIYVFADPAFFFIPENQKEAIESLLERIIKTTSWDMRMIIPLSAREAPIVKTLQQNTNIKIDYYLNSYQDCGKKSKFEAWDENLIGPPAQNVLNVALYLALFWGYKETYLIGADSSFLEDLRVDQETNELYTIDTHFYNNKEVHSDKKFYDQKKRGRSRKDWKLHELIYAHGRMFEYYSELKEYADYKGLKVYNASEYSWINVFERKKLG